MNVLVRHWNWKAALLSSSIRAAIFLFSSLSAGWHAALGAMFVELAFRPAVSGVLGALTQAFRWAQPAWLANITLMILLPAISHVIEYAVHWAHGTPHLARGIFWSIVFSWISTLMNLYAMRRGVLIVNEADAKPLGTDLKRIPALLAGFLAAGPLALIEWMRSRRMRSGVA